MKILLVDDDRRSRYSAGKFLKRLGHEVTECNDGESALRAYNQECYPMVLSDIKMPGITGIELLKSIKKLPSARMTDVVLFTGYGDMESAIMALRAGAYDYLLKPVNAEELAAVTERIAEHQSLLRENYVLTNQFEEHLKAATAETEKKLLDMKEMVVRSKFGTSIGFFSEQMQAVVELAHKYHADRSLPVVIYGETGSGKELIAQMIHYGDTPTSITAPFMDVNCAAFTPSLFESELFGYDPGSFTGGLSRGQKGKIETAAGGTLFLDEVAEIPIELQGKLLRVIQEKEFYRVGGVKKIKTDVRIICATNVDLAERVKEGKFRRDLYYRLHVGHIMIPPLRQRTEEILPLALLFLKDFAAQKKKCFRSISDAAAEILTGHEWTGNVRELRNVIEWVTFMYDDTELKAQHLAIIASDKATHGSRKSVEQEQYVLRVLMPHEGFSLEDLHDQIALKALEINDGNKSAAARYLGITRKTYSQYLDRAQKAAGKN